MRGTKGILRDERDERDERDKRDERDERDERDKRDKRNKRDEREVAISIVVRVIASSFRGSDSDRGNLLLLVRLPRRALPSSQ